MIELGYNILIFMASDNTNYWDRDLRVDEIHVKVICYIESCIVYILLILSETWWDLPLFRDFHQILSDLCFGYFTCPTRRIIASHVSKIFLW